MLTSHILGLTPKHSQPQQDCILTPEHCVALSFQVDTHRITYCIIVAYFKIWKERGCRQPHLEQCILKENRHVLYELCRVLHLTVLSASCSRATSSRAAIVYCFSFPSVYKINITERCCILILSYDSFLL